MRQSFRDTRQRRPGLVVQWMGTHIVFSTIKSSSQGLSVDESTVIPWDDTEHPFSEPEVLGAWISDEMARAGLTPARTIVSLPRQATMLRLIDVSHVDESDIPAAVAIHAEGVAHTLNRELAYDFLEHSGPDGSSRFATLVTCPKTVTEGIKAALKIAGCEVDICCLGELSLCHIPVTDRTKPSLIVLANDVKLDVILSTDQGPVAALATRMPPTAEDAATVVEQLRGRLLAGLPSNIGITDVSDLVVVGTRASSLMTKLTTLSEVQVTTISNATSHDLLARAILESCNSLKHVANLLNPTLPPNPWQQRTAIWLKRGSVLAGIVLIVTAGLFVWHDRLSSQLMQAQNLLQNTQNVLDEATPTVGKWEFLTSWQANAVDVTQQVVQLTNHLPDQERVYLTRLQIENAPGGDAAVLRLDGVALDNNDVMTLNRTLLDADYELRPHGIEPSARDSKFKSQFRIEASITNNANPE